MKDKSEFEICGAVKRKYVNQQGTFAVLDLETSVGGFRTTHAIKAFKDNVKIVDSLQVGEVVRVNGTVGRMSIKDCESAKMPATPGKDGKVFYPAIPTLNITSITKAQQSVSDDNFDDDKVPD